MLFSWWAATQGAALQIHFVQKPEPKPHPPHTHIQRHTLYTQTPYTINTDLPQRELTELNHLNEMLSVLIG